jgi:hypothetical protein
MLDRFPSTFVNASKTRDGVFLSPQLDPIISLA